MGKQIDKDTLEFIRKMAKEGNLESRLQDTDDAVGRISGIDFPKGTSPGMTDEAIKTRVLESMRRPKGMKAPLEGLEALVKKGLVKGAGKAALGAITGGLSLGAEAFDAPSAGPEPGTEDYEMETMDPRVRELRARGRERSEAAMAKQDPEAARLEKQAMDKKIEGMYPDTRSFEEQDKAAEKELRKRQILEGLRLK